VKFELEILNKALAPKNAAPAKKKKEGIIHKEKVKKKTILRKIHKNVPPEELTAIESNKLYLIVATVDVLFKNNPPPDLTEEIDLNVVSSTSTTPAFST
jgi:hypothetical protein